MLRIVLVALIVIQCNTLAAVSALAQTSPEQLVASFTGTPDAQNSKAALINIGGTLIGTTYYGGKYGNGTVFSVNPATGAKQVLYSFQGPSDGQYPRSALLWSNGELYGTTETGGSNNAGTVFAMSRAGKMKFVHSFGPQQSGDGATPHGELINVGGLLYGTTLNGGKGCGTIYSVNPATGAEAVVYSFKNGTDGCLPDGGLINIGSTLYGTTVAAYAAGVDSQCFTNVNSAAPVGTVFSFDLATDTAKSVYVFKGQGNKDGANPHGRMIKYGTLLYGTTECGGSGNNGTVFSINPANGAERVVYGFSYSDGAAPLDGLVGLNGVLYGTTQIGGASGVGVVFGIDLKTKTESFLYSFKGGANAQYPWGGLLDVGGMLFGSSLGGVKPCLFTIGCGGVYSIKP